MDILGAALGERLGRPSARRMEKRTGWRAPSAVAAALGSAKSPSTATTARRSALTHPIPSHPSKTELGTRGP